MTPYRHRRQRRAHRFRYGIRHWNKHRRNERHVHAGSSANTHRRWLVVVVGVLGVLAIVVLILGALSYRSISQARDSLNQAHATISQALGNRQQLNTPAGREKAKLEIAQVKRYAADAQATLQSSFSLKVLGSLPLLSTQRSGLLQLVNDVETTATTGDALLSDITKLTNDSSGTTVSLFDLEQLTKSVAVAHAQLAAAIRPTSGLWGPLGSARQTFNREDQKLTALLGTGSRALSYLLPLLGADGPRTYLIAGENNAEMRDQGDVLSLAQLQTANGSFSLAATSSVDVQPLSSPANVAVPAGTQAVFGPLQPTQLWQSVNATADYPFSGLDMQAMYAQATGTHVSGVIALDVPTLVSLLQLTGPVSVPGITQPISASNATDVLLHQLYSTYPSGSQIARHDDISDVARAAVDKMKADHVDIVALAQALAKDIAGRHLLIWDESPSYERTLQDVGASGAIDTTMPDRSFHLAVESATAAKLDYYVTASVRMVVGITKRNSAIVYTYVTISNHAPAGQSPSYQLGPDNINSFSPGQYVSRIYLWSPRGSSTVGGISESGLVVNQTATSVLPQQEQTVNFTTVIPNAVKKGHLYLHFVPQPTLVPSPISVQVIGGPNWKVASPAVIHEPLNVPRTLQWELSRR